MSLSTAPSESATPVIRLSPRALFRLILIAVGLGAILLPHIIWRVFSRRSPFARWFLRWSAWAAGARISVEGTPIRHNVLYISNHVSWLDILALSGATGCAFIAKADMAPWPVLGWLASQNNSVYVERDNRRSVHQQAGAVQAALETGQPLTLFPEGTTAGGRELLPFRSSLIAAVTPPPHGVMIQPVALDYGPDAQDIAWTDAESVGTNALRLMGKYRRIPLRISFLEPLAHSDFEDRKAIAAHSRAEIAAALGLG